MDECHTHSAGQNARGQHSSRGPGDSGLPLHPPTERGPAAAPPPTALDASPPPESCCAPSPDRLLPAWGTRDFSLLYFF